MAMNFKNLHLLNPSKSNYENIMMRQNRQILKDDLGHDVEYIVENLVELTDPNKSFTIVGATRSLAGLGKSFMTDAYKIDFQTYYIESNLLGLLKIPSLQVIVTTFEKNLSLLSNIIHNDEYVVMEARCKRLSQALNIIISHKQRGGNILACQEELIDNGLKDYADL